MVLGTDHAEMGALLLKKWSFPIDIINSVRWHHDPEYISSSLQEPTMQSDIVYLSNLILQSNGDDSSVDGKIVKPLFKITVGYRLPDVALRKGQAYARG
jgi:HD-like signal output (HDOD) protein